MNSALQLLLALLQPQFCLVVALDVRRKAVGFFALEMCELHAFRFLLFSLYGIWAENVTINRRYYRPSSVMVRVRLLLG